MVRFIPQSIKQEGLENHITKLGFSYPKFIELMETGATNTYAARALKNKDTGDHPSRHSVAKWRDVYLFEIKVAVQQAEMDALHD